MSTRALARRTFKRHPRQIKRLLMAFMGIEKSNAERVIADLQRDKFIKSWPFLEDGTRLYTLTTHGAREMGLDWRKFRRAPTAQAIQTGLLVAQFCAEHGHEKLTDDEFAEILPELAACPGRWSRRYFVDHKRDSLLTVVVIDLGARAKRVASRARREIDRRRPFGPWQDLIFNNLLQVVVLTPFGAMKAKAIGEQLENDTFPHAVVAVRGLEDLFLGGMR
jgi:hypothetical protein